MAQGARGLEALLLLARGRWAAEAAEAVCSGCNPLFCERTIGDVEAICLWLGASSDAASKCIGARCGPADCIPLDIWLMSDRVNAVYEPCRLPYWLIVETIGFHDTSIVSRRAPGPVDVYMTPTLLGQLVIVRGCAPGMNELDTYISMLEERLNAVTWVLYPVTRSICSRRG